MSDVLEFPQKPETDLIEEMKGPKRPGHSVFVDGHVIPNMTMIDRGDTIDLILDDRMIYEFPRDIAPLAARFAATAMAIGAGHPCISAPHQMLKAFATPVIGVDTL
jgi:hypothetical protein